MPNEKHLKVAKIDKINSSDLATPDSVEAITAAIFSTENTLCLTTESVQTTDSRKIRRSKEEESARSLSFQLSTTPSSSTTAGAQGAYSAPSGVRARSRRHRQHGGRVCRSVVGLLQRL